MWPPSSSRAPDAKAVNAFNTGHKTLEHGLDRLRQLEEHLHEAALEQIRAARRALESEWPALEADGYGDGALQDSVDAIADILSKETFYNELPALATATAQVQQAYAARHRRGCRERAEAYSAALEKLEATAGWNDLEEGRAGRDRGSPAKPGERGRGRGCPWPCSGRTPSRAQGFSRPPSRRSCSYRQRMRSRTWSWSPTSCADSSPAKSNWMPRLQQIHDRCLKSIADGTSVILAYDERRPTPGPVPGHAIRTHPARRGVPGAARGDVRHPFRRHHPRRRACRPDLPGATHPDRDPGGAGGGARGHRFPGTGVTRSSERQRSPLSTGSSR